MKWLGLTSSESKDGELIKRSMVVIGFWINGVDLTWRDSRQINGQDLMDKNIDDNLLSIVGKLVENPRNSTINLVEAKIILRFILNSTCIEIFSCEEYKVIWVFVTCLNELAS